MRVGRFDRIENKRTSTAGNKNSVESLCVCSEEAFRLASGAFDESLQRALDLTGNIDRLSVHEYLFVDQCLGELRGARIDTLFLRIFPSSS